MSSGQAAKKSNSFEKCCSYPSRHDNPCEVESLIHDMLFVKASHATLCPYRTSFGSSFACYCPKRKEVYEKYGV